MLYVTTRSDKEHYTVQHTLDQDRAMDGGFFVPFHVPAFSEAEIAVLKESSFNQCVANVINRLLHTELTCWDIDFAIGRYPVRLKPLGHRTWIAETWHNPEWDFQRIVSGILALLSKDKLQTSAWGTIAVRIAVLFAIYSELQKKQADRIDISVVSGDFSVPMSVWYARNLGLPVENIICCCNENNSLWNLLYYGHFRTDGLSISTGLPEADTSVPENLERLIYECGGVEETKVYLDCCRHGKLYVPSNDMLNKLRQGMFVSVASSKRVENTILGVYNTHGYVLTPGAALAYSGLMDYRANTGITRPAIILSEKSPIHTADAVAAAMKISIEELKKIL